MIKACPKEIFDMMLAIKLVVQALPLQSCIRVAELPEGPTRSAKDVNAGAPKVSSF